MKARTALLVACFVWFLYPVSVDGNSVNYSFVLLPLTLVLFRGKSRRPSPLLLAFVAYYVAIYLVASVYQYELYSEAGRRAISFLLFMSFFSYLFMDIDADMIRAFKVSLVVISLLFTLWSIATFVVSGAAALGVEEAKDVVGSQRFGFVYLLALSVLYLQPVQGLRLRFAKTLACSLLLIGVVLTFSRAAIVGTVVSVLGYLLWSLRHAFRRPARMLTTLTAIITCIAVGFFIVNAYLPTVSDFFEQRLFAFLTNPEAVQSTLSTSGTSEGERIYIWSQILEYLAYNPLTGSGYVGVWSLKLFEGMSGSAHSQYADVLFRTGWIGCLIYLYLVYRIFRHLYRHEPGLFWGFLGVLVYGVFHETFKDSQGGFLLAFLIGMMSHSPHAVAAASRRERELSGPTEQLGYGA
jgi:O-antigen ligase